MIPSNRATLANEEASEGVTNNAANSVRGEDLDPSEQQES